MLADAGRVLGVRALPGAQHVRVEVLGFCYVPSIDGKVRDAGDGWTRTRGRFGPEQNGSCAGKEWNTTGHGGLTSPGRVSGRGEQPRQRCLHCHGFTCSAIVMEGCNAAICNSAALEQQVISVPNTDPHRRALDPIAVIQGDLIASL